MTEVMNGLVSEAKNGKYSSIRPSLSDEDVVSVWENVSAFIEKQMNLQKGVNIPGLGIFTFSQKKLDVGNNKYILIQRPVFLLSEKFAQTHQVNHTKHHVTGQIPVVQLNFAALAFESPFDRDTVESCVKEVLGALARSVGARRNVEFTFHGIGRLQIRDSKVKMKFYKEFLNSMDGSGQLVNALKDRPGTVDSVMSEGRTPTRCGSSNTLILPRSNERITQGTGGLALENDKGPSMPTINENEEAACDTARQVAMGYDTDVEMGAAPEEGGEPQTERLGETDFYMDEAAQDTEKKVSSVPGSRAGSRACVPLATATGVSFHDDLMPQALLSPKGVRGNSVMSNRSGPTPMILKRSLSPIQGFMTPPDTTREMPPRPMSMDVTLKKPEPLFKVPTPPREKRSESACGHQDAGQELCYLCHQREARNIPVDFSAERKQREREEDRLLQQYQHMKDTESILNEHENLLAKRHESQKMAAFNLGVSEAVTTNKHSRDTKFQSSYIFQRRPLTPPRFLKQKKYFTDLHDQVNVKADNSKKRQSDEAFLERLEQVQLAEDLAMQRDQYIQDKVNQTDQYKRALSAQVRFKPLPIPARVPDSTEPVFGKNDMNAEKMAERRRQAHGLYKEQLATVEQRKRNAILSQLAEQKDAEDMLKRTKQELREDRADRYERLFTHRRRLEDDWAAATRYKREREGEERARMQSPGLLVHEQCDKYHRCDQCKRQLHNCGESNIWRDSRYIPGSRLMV